MPVTELMRVVFTVADVDRAADFYRNAFGLDVAPAQDMEDPAWNTLLGLDPSTRGRIASVSFGREAIGLVAFRPAGAPYPVPRASNDQWFQHVALVAGDIEAVWTRLEATSPESITKGEPVLLPPNTGSVTAFKFRDPEGHPLELIAFPQGVGAPRWQDGPKGIRGYDHTAIAVADLERSLFFYEGLLGFRIGGRSLNSGSEQDRLDGLAGCEVDVVALQPASAPTPHVELLHYRTPHGRTLTTDMTANDAASVRQVHKVNGFDSLVARLQAAGVAFVSPGIVTLGSGANAVAIRDPDGHMVVLVD